MTAFYIFQSAIFQPHDNNPATTKDGKTNFFFFIACFIAGGIGCAITHAVLVPLDLIKVRMQVNPTQYTSTLQGFRLIYKKGGLSSLFRGWVPTTIGYFLQGAFKFAGYEYFLYIFTPYVENRTLAVSYAGAVAELLADIFLSPFEAVKVRMQTSRRYDNKSMIQSMVDMYKNEGISVFFKGLVPLWCRQIPYTIVKFVSFDYILRLLYQYAVPKSRADCSLLEQLGVTFAAGYLSGVFIAVVTQPADYVVSKLNTDKNATTTKILLDAGFFGVWAGLWLRIAIIGILTALQWFTYDIFKLIVMSFQDIYNSIRGKKT